MPISKPSFTRLICLSTLLSTLSVTGPLVTGPALGAAPLPERMETYEGIAKTEDGKIVYREKHEVIYDGVPPAARVLSARTTYLSPDGTTRAELTSEFKGPAFLPAYSFKDLKLGIQEGVRCCSPDGTLEVYHQDKRKQIAFKPDWVSGQGFHYFSRASLEQIASGEKRLLQFLIPSRLEDFAFRIRQGKGQADRSGGANKEVEVVLEVQNWLLRFFAPSIRATYDTKTRRLLRYHGPSNIFNDQGQVQTVKIEYQYPN
ncbi:MAG: hypothetical protein ACK5QT_06325 [Oligoflexia bacterium]